jgi:hypothetical protein
MERLKMRSYHEIYARDYFWRTWEKQEIDLVEDYDGALHAWEFKWQEGKKSKIPPAWRENYPTAAYETITPENFQEFLEPEVSS